MVVEDGPWGRLCGGAMVWALVVVGPYSLKEDLGGGGSVEVGGEGGAWVEARPPSTTKRKGFGDAVVTCSENRRFFLAWKLLDWGLGWEF